MTELTKPVRRRTPRERLTVTLAPEGVYVREAGRRATYGPLAYGALLLACARVSVRAPTTSRRGRRVSRSKRGRGR